MAQTDQKMSILNDEYNELIKIQLLLDYGFRRDEIKIDTILFIKKVTTVKRAEPIINH